jgi:hypothetical protein
MTDWFRRLADVPGIGYQGSDKVNRSRLPGSNLVPETRVYDFDGKRRQSLFWPTAGGETSASPAQQWQTRPQKGETAAQTALRQLEEALELPGELADYHFRLQHCHDELWKYRREEPWVLPIIERLCWLDIQLIETYPAIITYESQDRQRHYYQVSAFERLITLYEREGFLYEALDVAKRAVRFENAQHALERLQTRLTILVAEANS